MAKHYSKAGRRLRQILKSHQRFKQSLNERLNQLNADYENVSERLRFFHVAIIALMDDGSEPDHWLLGATMTQHTLQQSIDKIAQQIERTRQWGSNHDQKQQSPTIV